MDVDTLELNEVDVEALVLTLVENEVETLLDTLVLTDVDALELNDVDVDVLALEYVE